MSVKRHCAEINEATRNHTEQFAPEPAKQYGEIEKLKAENQTEQARQKNASKPLAEAIVKFELIYE